jgi:hypothetical protein
LEGDPVIEHDLLELAPLDLIIGDQLLEYLLFHLEVVRLLGLIGRRALLRWVLHHYGCATRTLGN